MSDKSTKKEALREGDAAPSSSSDAPDVAAVFVSPDVLHAWPGNPRDNADAVKDVARSIRRFGFGAPIIARRENGEIIAGHTRFLAAKRLRLEKVPVRYLDLTEKEAHVLALADNKLGEIAAWDKDALAKILSEMQADDVELELGTGFSDTAIEKLIGAEDDGLGDDKDEGKARLKGMKYSVITECTDEKDQARLLERLDRDGYKCRPLMS